MQLTHLLAAIHPAEILGPSDIDILALTSDSRRVSPGTLFVAVPGVSVDGHDFIDKALSAGAASVVCERLPENRPEGVTFIRVASSAIALGELASQPLLFAHLLYSDAGYAAAAGGGSGPPQEEVSQPGVCTLKPSRI